MYAVRMEALLTNVLVVLPQQKVPKTQNTILYLCECKENLRQASPPKRFHLLRDAAGVGREYRDFFVSLLPLVILILPVPFGSDARYYSDLTWALTFVTAHNG